MIAHSFQNHIGLILAILVGTIFVSEPAMGHGQNLPCSEHLVSTQKSSDYKKFVANISTMGAAFDQFNWKKMVSWAGENPLRWELIKSIPKPYGPASPNFGLGQAQAIFGDEVILPRGQIISESITYMIGNLKTWSQNKDAPSSIKVVQQQLFNQLNQLGETINTARLISIARAFSILASFHVSGDRNDFLAGDVVSAVERCLADPSFMREWNYSAFALIPTYRNIGWAGLRSCVRRPHYKKYGCRRTKFNSSSISATRSRP